jgi:hypothetical protein
VEDLNIAFKELKANIGEWQGYGRGADYGEQTWSTAKERIIRDGLKSGMRRFYYCFSEKYQNTYDWSFLRPFTDLTLKSGQSTAELPEDAGGIVGQVTIGDGTSVPRILQVWGPARIAARFAILPTATGSPEWVSVRPQKRLRSDGPPRTELYVFPTANADYVLSFQYFVNPKYLSGDLPYAYGGPEHAETLIAACKASAELDRDGKIAEREAFFQQRLAASIQIDRRKKEQFIGYNGNPRNDRHRHLWGQVRWPVITINGVTPP